MMRLLCVWDKTAYHTLLQEVDTQFDYNRYKTQLKKEMWTYLTLSAYAKMSISKIKMILNGYSHPTYREVAVLEFLSSMRSPQKKWSDALNTILIPIWELEQDTGVDRRTIRRLKQGKTIHDKEFIKMVTKIKGVL